jgi:hypothetical protein
MGAKRAQNGRKALYDRVLRHAASITQTMSNGNSSLSPEPETEALLRVQYVVQFLQILTLKAFCFSRLAPVVRKQKFKTDVQSK